LTANNQNQLKILRRAALNAEEKWFYAQQNAVTTKAESFGDAQGILSAEVSLKIE